MEVLVPVWQVPGRRLTWGGAPGGHLCSLVPAGHLSPCLWEPSPTATGLLLHTPRFGKVAGLGVVTEQALATVPGACARVCVCVCVCKHTCVCVIGMRVGGLHRGRGLSLGGEPRGELLAGRGGRWEELVGTWDM